MKRINLHWSLILTWNACLMKWQVWLCTTWVKWILASRFLEQLDCATEVTLNTVCVFSLSFLCVPRVSYTWWCLQYVCGCVFCWRVLCLCVSAMVHCHHEPAGDLAHRTHGSAAPRLPAQNPHQDHQGNDGERPVLPLEPSSVSACVWRWGLCPPLQKKYRDFRLQGVLDSTLNSKMYDTVRNRLTLEEATASVREGGMQGISMKDSDEEDEEDD